MIQVQESIVSLLTRVQAAEDRATRMETAALSVLALGSQFIKGVTLAKAPLGDTYDARWQEALIRLEEAIQK